MRNAGLEETQTGIKIAGRNINNLRYADDTTLMAESKEGLKSLLVKVKEESEKVGLKLISGRVLVRKRVCGANKTGTTSVIVGPAIGSIRTLAAFLAPSLRPQLPLWLCWYSGGQGLFFFFFFFLL